MNNTSQESLNDGHSSNCYGRGIAGAGRPANSNRTARQLKAVERTFEKMALANNIPLGQLLAEIVYNCNWIVRITASGRKLKPEVPYNTRLRAIELYLHTVVTKYVQHDRPKCHIGPIII